MRLILASTLFALALLTAGRAAAADVILIKPSLGLLQSYGPQNLDGGPDKWQDNRSPGFALEIGRPFGPHDLTLGGHVFRHNHMSIFFLALYRYHFGARDQLHLFVNGGPGIGCINHRDYFNGGESDTCSGGWHLAAGGGVWVPLVPHLALTGEAMAIGSFPEKRAFTPMISASLVVNL